MTRDYLTIGSSPTEEDCAQVGSGNYEYQSKLECKAFIHQLRRVFGEEPEGASLSIKSFPHDFGTYREVVCYYDPDEGLASEYAFRLENDTPAKWDTEALEELSKEVD